MLTNWFNRHYVAEGWSAHVENLFHFHLHRTSNDRVHATPASKATAGYWRSHPRSVPCGPRDLKLLYVYSS